MPSASKPCADDINTWLHISDVEQFIGHTCKSKNCVWPQAGGTKLLIVQFKPDPSLCTGDAIHPVLRGKGSWCVRLSIAIVCMMAASWCHGKSKHIIESLMR